MIKESMFFRSEEDTDFMPIIPMNEQESEQDKNMVIPGELAILHRRNKEWFPGVCLLIRGGRVKG